MSWLAGRGVRLVQQGDELRRQVGAPQFGRGLGRAPGYGRPRVAQPLQQNVRVVALAADLERVHRRLPNLVLGGENRQAGYRPGRIGVRDAAQALDQPQPQVRRLGGEDLHQGRGAGRGHGLSAAPVDRGRALVLLFANRRELLPEGVGVVAVAAGLPGLGVRRRGCALQRLADQPDREGELTVALALGPAGVPHGEGQAVQVGPVAAKG